LKVFVVLFFTLELVDIYRLQIDNAPLFETNIFLGKLCQ
jgi:hypothetical protein